MYYTGGHGDGQGCATTGRSNRCGSRRRDLPQSAGHPFYERLNRILEAAGFDAFVEGLCAPFYAVMGRPSPAPGRYFRLLLIGYFEGLDSERGIAWARGGFAEHAGVSAFGGASGAPGPFDDLADASAVPGGDPSGSVHLGAGAVGGVGLGGGEDVGRRCCGVVASWLSVRLRTCLRPAGCAGCTFGSFEHSEAPAGARRGPQPRAASAPGDRHRHAPRPAGRGGIRRLRAARAVFGPGERSGAALDAIPAPFGAGRRTIEPSAPSASHLNTGDFYLGLLGSPCCNTRPDEIVEAPREKVETDPKRIQLGRQKTALLKRVWVGAAPISGSARSTGGAGRPRD